MKHARAFGIVFYDYDEYRSGLIYVKVDNQGTVIVLHRDTVDLKEIQDIQETSDGGYIVIGSSLDRGGEYVSLHKISQDGYTEFNRAYYTGQEFGDRGRAVSQTSDGGYILYATYNDYGSQHPWIIKTDLDGVIEWYEGYLQTIQYTDTYNHIIQTSDGGYLLIGSIDGDISLWKIESDGTHEWCHVFGSSLGDVGLSVEELVDGYGVKALIDDHMEWHVKLDNDFNIVWDEKISIPSGTHGDTIYSYYLTSNGGIVMTGMTEVMSNDGDIVITKFTRAPIPDFVIPEYPLGIIISVTTMLLALVMRRRTIVNNKTE